MNVAVSLAHFWESLLPAADIVGLEHGLELENMLRTDPARGLSVFIFSNSNIYNNMNNDNIFIHAIYVMTYELQRFGVWGEWGLLSE